MLIFLVLIGSNYTPKASSGGVALTGNQTIAGVKTFSSPPVMSGASISAGTVPSASLATVAVANGGTGSATQNFVDLSTNQATIAGNKTLTGATTIQNLSLDTSAHNLIVTGGGLVDWRATGNLLSFSNSSYGTHTVLGNGAMFNFVVGPTGDTTQIPAGAQFADSAIGGLTAAGTNQATCLQLSSDKVDVSTVASGTGVCLPLAKAGSEFYVHTSGANSLLIYMNPAGGIINALSASTGIAIANVAGATPGARRVTCISTTQCWSNATLPDTN